MLGHGASRAGGDQRGRGGDVERPLAAPGSGRVQEIVSGNLDRGGERPHRLGESGDLLDGLALGAQGDQEGRDLDLRGLAGHHLRQDGRRLLLGQVVFRRPARRSRPASLSMSRIRLR